jgi:hypothetical protein
MTGRPFALLLVALAISLAAPALAAAQAPPAAHPTTAQRASDPMTSLGASSPLCGRDVGSKAQANCRKTGSLERPYPLEHYGFDWHIKTGVTKFTGNLLSVIQWFGQLVWTNLLYLLQGVLLVFQWAFSLDLLGSCMTGVRGALTRLSTNTLGRPWFDAAIALLGLWGIWRGLVQRKTIETVAGLGIAIVMMAGALFVIHDPVGTVGQLSRGANQTSLAFLSGVADGTVNHPDRTVANSSNQIFKTLVLRPWCALNFADVDWCMSKAPGDQLTHAERFLRYDVNTKQRNAEYQVLNDPKSEPWKHTTLGCDSCAKDDQALKDQFAGYRVTAADAAHVKIQQQGSTTMRVGLLLLVVIAQLGYMFLLGWLSFKVLVQGIMTLVLLLGTPAMLFAPAFGDGGRSLFRKWAMRLFAALVSKAIYALLLAIVLAIGAVLAQLDGSLPWFVTWIVQIVFAWGIVIKRGELLGWLSFGVEDERTRSAGALYYKAQGLKAVGGALAGGGVGGFMLARGFGRRGQDAVAERRDAQSTAVQQEAGQQLEQRARDRLQHRYDDYHERLTAHDDAKRKLGSLDKRLSDYDRRAARPQRNDKDGNPLPRQRPSSDEAKAIAQRRALQQKLMTPSEEGVAREFIKSADKNLVEQGQRFSDRQVELQMAELRSDVLSHPNADAEIHSWRAGIPASELSKLSPEERSALHGRVAEDLARDRALFAAVGEHPDHRPGRRERREAAGNLDAGAVAERRRQELHQRRAERRVRRREGRQLRRSGR